MKKRIFSLLMLSMMVFGMASAQNVVTVENPDGSKDVTTTSFNPHWFLQLQAGGQYTLGEACFSDLLSPNAQVALGYQFSPVWALRLGVNAWQSKGGWGENTAAAWTGYNGSNTFKWNYFAPALDVKFNIVNAIAGWKPGRVFTANLIAGVGLNLAQELKDDAPAIYAYNPTLMSHYRDGSAMMPVGRVGLDLDFAVSERVSINVEGMANVLNDHYNGKHTDNADWYFNVLAGVKVALGKTVKKTVEHIPAPAPVVREEPKPAPAPAPAPVVKVEPYKCNVFFQINKSVAVAEELQKVADLAAYMQKYPECKVTLSGFADKGTGNAKINERLSQARVNYVADLLRNQYNIDADRIFTEYKGDTVQPFAENDMNRVTVCVTK